MKDQEKIILGPSESAPQDPFTIKRQKHIPTKQIQSKKESLKHFLLYDGHVLRFYCLWDDRENMFGEVRHFVVHYYLVDGSVEVREKATPNNGRPSSTLLLRRQPLPKQYDNLAEMQFEEKYTYHDFSIGATINVLGRNMLIFDVDEYTRSFYKKEMGKKEDEMKPLSVDDYFQKPKASKREIPPYNGFGSFEDSLGSWKNLVLKPFRRDVGKLLEFDNQVLRFLAVLISPHKEDSEREFIICYRLADDMMTIYETPKKNAGFLGGKFMERSKVLIPGATMQNPEYYTITDLYIGAHVQILSHHFKIVNADEHVFKYMEDKKEEFPKANFGVIIQKIKSQVRSQVQLTEENIHEQLNQIGITAHEVMTLQRHFKDWTSFLNAIK